MNWDLIEIVNIIFLIWCCWVWSGIMADEIMNTILKSIERKNNE